MSIFVKSFRWYDVLFNTKAWQAFVARQVEMQKDRVLLENNVHQLQAANRDYVRKLLERDQKLDECRNRIAVLSGAASESNLPYTVQGKHGSAQDRPKSDVRSGDSRVGYREQMVTPQPSGGHVSDNSALLTAAAFAVVDSDFRAHVVEPINGTVCAPAYREPETPSFVQETQSQSSTRDSYSAPSRSDDSPSYSDTSPAGGCD